MNIFEDLAALTRDQRATFLASVLGWTLDAFDFFLMVFVVRAIAGDFHTQIVDVAFSITLTLMFRPLGALVFGWLAEVYGRRPILMINVLLFSFFELATAFAPSLGVFLILRALFGFAMGGEWGIGASLVMESIPARSRGTVSGILQQGYPLGYLLASVVYGLFFDAIGWRGMFVIGVVPALLVFFIRYGVKESPVWEQRRREARRPDLVLALQRHWKIFLYVILLMTAFNFFSHGTQDIYPTFLQAQHHLTTHMVSAISIVMNVGAIMGGISFGFFSQRIGRRRAIITAALMLGLGAFLLQMMVQGAWGVIPAHLNELSPEELRGTFPGFAYQLGNLLAACNAIIQPIIAKSQGGNYGLALSVVVTLAVVAIVVITACGREAKAVVFGAESGHS
jgi:SHS family lactate transporter-like MFS transporter